jgi:DNA repair exonuclease SbcCD ATPase subunit
MATTPALKPNPPSIPTKATVLPVNVEAEQESAADQQSSLMVLAKDFQSMIEAAEHQHANSLLEVKTAIEKARGDLNAKLLAAQEKFQAAGQMAKEAATEIDEAYDTFGDSVDDALEHLEQLRKIRMRRPKK